jgi:hypothetical protein
MEKNPSFLENFALGVVALLSIVAFLLVGKECWEIYTDPCDPPSSETIAAIEANRRENENYKYELFFSCSCDNERNYADGIRGEINLERIRAEHYCSSIIYFGGIDVPEEETEAMLKWCDKLFHQTPPNYEKEKNIESWFIDCGEYRFGLTDAVIRKNIEDCLRQTQSVEVINCKGEWGRMISKSGDPCPEL